MTHLAHSADFARNSIQVLPHPHDAMALKRRKAAAMGVKAPCPGFDKPKLAAIPLIRCRAGGGGYTMSSSTAIACRSISETPQSRYSSVAATTGRTALKRLLRMPYQRGVR